MICSRSFSVYQTMSVGTLGYKTLGDPAEDLCSSEGCS